MLENPLDSKEIKSVNAEGKHPEYSLEGLMLKLKLQSFGKWMASTALWSIRAAMESTRIWSRVSSLSFSSVETDKVPAKGI